MPKILIVFYSRTGNTARVALDLASHLDADIEEIIDKKKRTGLFSSITGGRDAMKQKLTDIAPMTKNPTGYDLVIIGSPIWGGNLSPAVRTYLSQCQSLLGKFAFFITSSDTDPASAAQMAAQVAGKDPVAFTGFNKQELAAKLAYEEKIALFADQIKHGI
ncbi:MAG: flavodoxin domain-containing protein [Candidatus Pacebacteria bacterium]|nr:flavodoxin domain-containing protein [Candidatus Paceibacterota bacterium]